MKSSLTILFLAAALAAAIYMVSNPHTDKQLLKEFQKFKTTFGKRYESTEEAYRLSIFESNLKLIESHNADQTQTYKLGVTQFADMDKNEFKSKILMQKPVQPSTAPKLLGLSYQQQVKAIDWTTSGAVSAVKNQGSCGSCWSFSTTGALESAYQIAKGSLPNYSEQQLVDCCITKNGYKCQGCNGAWPEWALDYVKNVGIVAESAYPYRGVQGTCSVSSGTKILSSYTMLAAGDVNALTNSLNKQPVSICVDASNWSLYKSGIFTNCGKTNLDHAVLAVGIDASGIWKVKNSWAASWGESGFIRLAAGNTCGIAQHAIIPTIL